MTADQKYKQVREDFEELETLAELNDWMSIEENMVTLMRDPSKARAADLYDSAITLWFREHGVTEDTADIAERYNIR